MTQISLELDFPDDDALKRWLASTPPHGFEFDFAQAFIPNDAPKPPTVAELGVELAGVSNPVVVQLEADGWDAAAAIAHASSFGATGRAVLVDVPHGWVEEYDDPRDATIHLLLELGDDDRRETTLSGRQAKAYLAKTGVPSLQSLKAELRAQRKR